MGEMDAYKSVFLAESTDYIQQITDGLLALEREPYDLGPVEAVFRGAHSLKGMSAAMGYARTTDLTHAMEGLMSRVRAGESHVDKDLIDLMLRAVDLVRELIDDEAAGTSATDPEEIVSALGLRAARSEDLSPEGVAASAPELVLGDGERAVDVLVTLERGSVLKGVRAYMALKRLNQLGRVIDTTPSVIDLEDERFDVSFSALVATGAPDETLCEALLGIAEIASIDITAAELDPQQAPDDGTAGRDASSARSLARQSDTHTVRVAIDSLDTLVDLVGEVVILRSRFDRLVAAREEDLELVELLDELHRITGELQYEVLRTRMVPVGNIFRRFPRLVRDLAIDLGKQVDFETTGLDIELDRTLLDEIGDSIVHLLRNAIDHGIEPAEERVASGKPPAGALRLSAARERDHVAIAVADDGRGINAERVWVEACGRGLARAQDRSQYSESDILMLTCMPGFSTTRVATRISGRGVGLDAVKEHIEGIGGTIQISNRPGHGTEFLLRLPLTLAIVKALIVEVCGQSFALPLSAVNEVLAIEEQRIETVDSVPVLVRSDGDVVPLVRLDSILFGATGAARQSGGSNIVLVALAGERHALLVDRLLGRQEIVVKPLGRLLAQAPGYSGATILGDGRVMLILDPRTMFSHSEVSP